jgi:hypothetical protein
MPQRESQERGSPPAEAEPQSAPANRAPSLSLDDVEAPLGAASVTLVSGRRYELEAGSDADRVTIRGRTGEVVLRIEVTDAGPVLSFSGASIEIAATRRLHLAAEEVAIDARRDLALSSGGSLEERIGGHHHTHVAGDERLEAASVEIQANTGAVGVRAMGRIGLDGEHIGLNDDPMPQPFGWSAIADEEEPSSEEPRRPG